MATIRKAPDRMPWLAGLAMAFVAVLLLFFGVVWFLMHNTFIGILLVVLGLALIATGLQLGRTCFECSDCGTRLTRKDVTKCPGCRETFVSS
jgi:hypothetical protein